MEQTALHWAAIKGHERIAILLLEKGAYVDHVDKSDRNPLYYAIRNVNYSVANVFIFLWKFKITFISYYFTTKHLPGHQRIMILKL